jgi:intracellular sulfur oxidation DsrE/DsrF family protein
MLLVIRLFTLTVALLTAHTAVADKFIAGPAIKNYGKHAKVQQQLDFDQNRLFKIAFDISEQAEIGKINRQIETLARFINMHVANGVPAKNIHLALVVHGKAGFDLLKAPLYQEKFKKKNTNNALLQALMNNQVEVLLCGQSAAYFDIAKDMLMPGVKMALSAMTAHAVLQSNGYSVNPF